MVFREKNKKEKNKKRKEEKYKRIKGIDVSLNRLTDRTKL
jgi:hypothetical protein